MTVQRSDGLEEIGRAAFHSCISLERVVIPPGVKVIGNEAFRNCSQLTTVNLGEGLEDIR